MRVNYFIILYTHYNKRLQAVHWLPVYAGGVDLRDPDRII